MITELITDFLKQLAITAIDEYAMMSIVNDGGPARFIAVDLEREVAFAMFVADGETVRVNRAFRLIVERLDTTVIRPLCIVHNQWSTH